MSRNSHQAGAAVTFVVIAIILAVVTIGSVVLVVHRGQQARNTTASQLAAKASTKATVTHIANSAPAPTTTSSTTTNTATVSLPTALPTTGADFNVIQVMAVGLITITLTSFVLSRRSLGRSL